MWLLQAALIALLVSGSQASIAVRGNPNCSAHLLEAFAEPVEPFRGAVIGYRLVAIVDSKPLQAVYQPPTGPPVPALVYSNSSTLYTLQSPTPLPLAEPVRLIVVFRDGCRIVVEYSLKSSRGVREASIPSISAPKPGAEDPLGVIRAARSVLANTTLPTATPEGAAARTVTVNSREKGGGIESLLSMLPLYFFAGIVLAVDYLLSSRHGSEYY